MGEEFFAALAHVRHIHANCRALLRSQHQRAGLELMDTMANLQETAYEKLCRWGPLVGRDSGAGAAMGAAAGCSAASGMAATQLTMPWTFFEL